MKKYLPITLLIMSLIAFCLQPISTIFAQRTESQTQLTPLSYQLNALEPKKLSDFYHQSLGLSLLEEKKDQNYYRLGLEDGTTLLEIFPAESPRSTPTGLYHTAFLFKEKQDQINAFARAVRTGAAIQGSADHNVSQAIYLGDPENNDIELYWDLPKEEWTYDAQGNIQMGNAPLDIKGYITQGDASYEAMSDTAKIGHFHLAVSDLQKAQYFYQEILGFKITSNTSTDALFMASGDYHHHLGLNTWDSLDAPAPEPNQQGLRRVIWQTSNPDDLKLIQTNLNQAEIEYEAKDNTLTMKDFSGIQHRIQLVQP